MPFAIVSVASGLFLLTVAACSKLIERSPDPRLMRFVLAAAGLTSILIGLFWVAGETALESDELTRTTYLVTGSATAGFLCFLGLLFVRLARSAGDGPLPRDDMSLPPTAVRLMGYISFAASAAMFILALVFTVFPP
jgi:hypothetical protein